MFICYYSLSYTYAHCVLKFQVNQTSSNAVTTIANNLYYTWTNKTYLHSINVFEIISLLFREKKLVTINWHAYIGVSICRHVSICRPKRVVATNWHAATKWHAKYCVNLLLATNWMLRQIDTPQGVLSEYSEYVAFWLGAHLIAQTLKMLLIRPVRKWPTG